MNLVHLFRSHRSRKDLYLSLLRPHLDLLYRMAYRWTGSRDEAEDLVQDILERLAPRIDEMRRVDKLRPWLIRVLYRRYVDLYRRRRRSPVEFESSPAHHDDGETMESRIQRAVDPDNAIDRLELQQMLSRALGELDDDQSDVILLHDVEGYSAIEVAEILDINVGTVKSRLHRGRTRLKKFLAPGTF